MKKAPWYGAATIILIIFLTIYGTVQQSQRNAANYPQVQIATDIAAGINNQPNGAKIDMSTSLAPFYIVYDKSGNAIGGNAYLLGKYPNVPIGMLTSSSNKDYSFVTWQPASGLRFAAVTVSSNSNYVVSARSLKLVESNESKTQLVSFLGLILAEAALVLTYILTHNNHKRKKSDSI